MICTIFDGATALVGLNARNRNASRSFALRDTAWGCVNFVRGIIVVLRLAEM